MPLCGNFKSQLRFWGSHAIFCATPSFFFAFVGDFASLGGIAGMSLGIMVWVGIYAALTSSTFANRHFLNSPLGRAVWLGAKIRSGLAVAGLLFFFVQPFVHIGVPGFFLMPELYAGFLSIEVVTYVTGIAHYGFQQLSFHGAMIYTLLLTLSVGFFLSFTLGGVILAPYLFIRYKDRVRQTAKPN